MSNPSKRNPLWFLSGLVLLVVMVTRSASAQFGDSAIVAWLSTCQQFMTTYIGPVMTNINKVETNIN